MSYVAVLEQIKKGQIKSIYLLYGEETYFIRQIEQAVIKAVLAPDEMDMNLVTLDREPTVNELMALIETVPFMGGRNVIVVRGTTLFHARKTGSGEETQSIDHADDRLLQLIANMPDYVIVIFSTNDKVDKRRKIFKLVEKHGVTVEAAHLKAKDVRGWLASKLTELNKKMASDAIEYFLGIVSIMSTASLGFLHNE